MTESVHPQEAEQTDLARFLFLIDNLRPGGAQKALFYLLRSLRATRAETTVWCLGGTSEIEEEFYALGVPVLGKPRGFFQLAAQPAALRRYIRKEKVALVQTFLFHADVLGRVASRCARRRCGSHRTPVVVSSVRATNRDNRWWQFVLQRVTAPLADAFTAVSRRTLDFAVAHEGVIRERATVIPNGIDLTPWEALPEQAQARRELGIPADARVIATLGRLHEQKGHGYLLAAAKQLVAQHPETLLLVAGYGPLREQLENTTRALGIEKHVRFLGYRTDVARILAAADIFALPSLWEGMSNALLEAMAAGKPVVATEIDGNVEQVVSGETGLLVPPADAESLAAALTELCADPALAEAMGKRGRERVASVFPAKGMTEATLDLYARLLAATAGIPPEAWRT